MKRKREILFIIILLLSVLAMILYSSAAASFRTKPSRTEELSLNQQELQFVKAKKTVTISVPENLEYLNHGFLQEYVSSIIAPSGLKTELVTGNKNETDASIEIVEDKHRKNIDKNVFTAPLFSVTGSIFIDENKNFENGLTGVVLKNQFSEEEKKTLSYDGKLITLKEVNTIDEAVELAVKENLDCILGDQTSIIAALAEKELQYRYVDMCADFYEKNVCIVTDKNDETLYSVLNQCVHSADLRTLVTRAQEHWFGIPESLVKEDRYKDAAGLLIVVFAAVFCAFFFYYQSNKNLYNELTERMNQLVASKQEMQTTFNSVSYYMAELDPKGIVLDINRAFLSYVNRDSLGRNIADVLELSEELKETLSGMLDHTGNTRQGTSKEITLKNHILEVNIFPIMNPKGEAEKLLFMASDVTGVRMAERQMLQDNKMIAVGQLAAGVAHEIRNPLGIIRNYCYVLKNMKNPETQEQAVQVIEKSVDTAGHIIDNLLDFSRISKKRSEEVLIKKHIDSVISLNKGMLKKKQIGVFLQCEEDFQVKMAVESFDMIFINLISNAIDAMDQKGHLTIRIYKTEPEFYVEVTDTGTGIEKDILGDIFNPFFTTKATTKGNGLGLYIVYNEVKKMNGDIEVSSKIEEGTTFKVILPVRMEEEQVE